MRKFVRELMFLSMLVGLELDNNIGPTTSLFSWLVYCTVLFLLNTWNNLLMQGMSRV
jgi:hypothetical protein